MKEITVGTTNIGKLEQIRMALASYGVSVSGLSGFSNLPKIAEDGATAQENALSKALAYAEAIGKPVLATDYALFFDGLPPHEQPGLNVRRIPGHDHRPTDEEMISYYSALVDRNGGRMEAWWEYAIAAARPDGEGRSVVLETPRRLFLSRPSSVVVSGHPLGSLQFDLKLGKYITELTPEEEAAYWRETIGESAYTLIEEMA